jgi:nucleotidyltransferase substrate binding protein (TIGR01987 family)
VASPRSAIKQAFNAGLISNGHEWMEVLNDRNMTSHVYDEETARNIYQLISSKYYPMFVELQNTFSRLDHE